MTLWLPESAAPRTGELILGAFLPNDAPDAVPAVSICMWSEAEDGWVTTVIEHESDPEDGWFFCAQWLPGAMVAWAALPLASAPTWDWVTAPPKSGVFLALSGYPWPQLMGWSDTDQAYLAADVQICFCNGRSDPYFETDRRMSEDILAWCALPPAPVRRGGVWG